MITIDQALSVTSRTELVAFLERLQREMLAGPVENQQTHDYLEALARYLRDLPGFVKNSGWPGGVEEPTWALVAAALAGALIYE